MFQSQLGSLSTRLSWNNCLAGVSMPQRTGPNDFPPSISFCTRLYRVSMMIDLFSSIWSWTIPPYKSFARVWLRWSYWWCSRKMGITLNDHKFREHELFDTNRSALRGLFLVNVNYVYSYVAMWYAGEFSGFVRMDGITSALRRSYLADQLQRWAKLA
jgi:hypothetical protein